MRRKKVFASAPSCARERKTPVRDPTAMETFWLAGNGGRRSVTLEVVIFRTAHKADCAIWCVRVIAVNVGVCFRRTSTTGKTLLVQHHYGVLLPCSSHVIDRDILLRRHL